MTAPADLDPKLAPLLARAKSHPMTGADREEQARSFAYGNVALSNPDVTREMVDRAADASRGGADLDALDSEVQEFIIATRCARPRLVDDVAGVFAELRAARETNRALEGIAEAAEKVLLYAQHRARLAERGSEGAGVTIVGYRVCADIGGKSKRSYTPADDDPEDDTVSDPSRAQMFDDVTKAREDVENWNPTSHAFVVAVHDDGCETPVEPEADVATETAYLRTRAEAAERELKAAVTLLLRHGYAVTEKEVRADVKALADRLAKP